MASQSPCVRPMLHVTVLVLLLLVDMASAHPKYLPFRPKHRRKLLAAQSSADASQPSKGTPGDWDPNPSGTGFRLALQHRDHPSSPYKRSFSDRHHQIATYLKEDRLRGAHLRSKVHIDSDSHEINAREPYDFTGSRETRGRKLSAGSPAPPPSPTYNLSLNDADATIGNHYVNIEIGTPPVRQSLIFDTGSDLIWVQCNCTACHVQKDPLYRPLESTSFSPVPCNSALCRKREVQGPARRPNCRQSGADTCRYNYFYNDGSTQGRLAYETLTLGTYLQMEGKFALKNTIFGCGQTNTGFDVVSGVLGMGRTGLSLPNQLQPFYNNIFSSCMLSEESVISSQVVFGEAAVPADGVQYTPLLTNRKDKIPAFYYVQVVGVFVESFKVRFKKKAFALHRRGGGGTIFDSGTTFGVMYRFAWWPIFNRVVKSTIDAPLSDPFHNGKEKMWPCFQLQDDSLFPVIEFRFKGNASIAWGPNNYLVEVETNKVCVAIQPSKARGNLLGGSLQEDMLIVWDRKNARLGLRPTDCASGEPIIDE